MDGTDREAEKHRLSESLTPPVPSPAVPPRPGVLRRYPAFRILWTARTISYVGDGVALVALLLYVKDIRDSGPAVGLLLLSQSVPRLLAPFAGAVADRLEQRGLMISCEIGQAIVYGTIALWLPSLPVLMLLVAAAAALSTFFVPAGRSSIPALVEKEDLATANAWLSTALNLQVALGPAIGGALVGGLGIEGALAVNAASFAVSALMLLRVPRLPPVPATEQKSILGETREGLRFVLGHPVARAVIVSLFIGVTIAAIDNVALVFLARDTFGVSPFGFGLMASAWGIGMLTVSIALIGVARRMSPRFLFVAGWLATGVGLLITGLVPYAWMAGVMQGFGGAGNAADNVATDTLIGANVERGMLGRVFGSVQMSAYLGSTIAFVAGGWLVEVISPRSVFVLAGVGALAGALLAQILLPRDV